MRSPMRALAVLLAAGVTAGSLVGHATGADRFTRHSVRGQGVSLATPASWKAIDSGLSESALRELERRNPQLAPYLRQLAGQGSAAKFFAFDPALRNGFATNVNVVVVPIPSIGFAQYRAALLAEIRSLVSGPVAARTVTVHGARAVRLGYRLRITAGRAYTVQTLQYAFQRPGRSVVVTYTTLPSSQDRYARTFARSAASIRFS